MFNSSLDSSTIFLASYNMKGKMYLRQQHIFVSSFFWEGFSKALPYDTKASSGPAVGGSKQEALLANMSASTGAAHGRTGGTRVKLSQIILGY